MSGQNMVCPVCGAFQSRAENCVDCGVCVDEHTQPETVESEKITEPARAPSQSYREPIRFPLRAVIVIALIVVGLYGVPKLFDAEPTLDEQMQDIPVFEMLKANDAAAYERLKTLLHASVRDGASQPEIIARVQVFFAGLMKQYMPNASDDAVDDYAHELRRILDDARGQSASLCYDLMYPERYTRSEVQQFLEQRLDTRFLDAMGVVIESANQNPQPPPDAALAKQLLDGALTPLVERHRDDMRVFLKQTHNEREKKMVCDLGTKMYRAITLLSKRNASLALRYLVTQS